MWRTASGLSTTTALAEQQAVLGAAERQDVHAGLGGEARSGTAE